MRVGIMLDDIEQTCEARGLRKPNRFVLLDWAGQELREITSKAQFDWSLVHLDPAVSTVSGKRAYPLPEGFPENFVRNAGTNGDQWCCKLDDGTNEALIDYVSPVQFFSANLRGTSSARPTKYTIMATSSGGREIQLYPTPNANGTTGYYTIDGLYQPTDLALDEQAQLPVISANNPVVKFGVLRRIDPATFEPKYTAALNDLIYAAALERRAQLTPVLGPGGSLNQYRATQRGR